MCAAALLLAVSPLATVHAAASEYAIDNGYAFGRSTDADGNLDGFTVTDDGGLGFWSAYQQLGGEAVLGPAISARFMCADTVCQAFERALLRWDNSSGSATPLAVLDEVHASGNDAALAQKLHIPSPDGSSMGDVQSMLVQLGPNATFWIGTPEAAADTPLGTVVRGTYGAAVLPPGGAAYIVGAGALAVAAGMVPRTALQTTPLPASAGTPPATLWIPRINLSKSLTATDPEADGYLPAPEGPGNVIWYTNSAQLNESGTMVIAGHVDWVTGGAAFFHLADLEPGDEVSIGDGSGQQATYAVTAVTLDDGDTQAVRQAVTNPGLGAPTLTLITCGGPFDVATRTYLQRLVVTAVRE
jgi:sortase family protein